MSSKKLLSLVLCMCMLMSLLTGCGLGGRQDVELVSPESDKISEAVDGTMQEDADDPAPEREIGETEALQGGAADGEDIYLAEEEDINYDTQLVSGGKSDQKSEDKKKEKKPEASQDGTDQIVNADELEQEITDPIIEAIDKNLNGSGNSENVLQTGGISGGSTATDEPFDIIEPEDFEEGLVEYADNTIMVKIKKNFKDETMLALLDAGVGKLEPLFELEKYTWYTAYLLKGVDVNSVLEQVRTVKGVETAEYNYTYEASTVTDIESVDTTAAMEAVCGNPKFGEKWHMKDFGIPQAWAVAMTDEGVAAGTIVAVIDTGVDYNHIDLKANMWKNTGEIDGNGIDDDGNGYVDDYYGIDMTAKRGSGMDDNGHGTHVAGIIGASNNKEGIVGLAYNTQIMAIKAGDASGYFLQNNVAEAIIYAYEHGADVINMSFGGSASSVAVQDALAVAYNRCVLVAAAGNDGAPNEPTESEPGEPNYPAAFSYVLGVMSVGNSLIESGFTNWDVTLYNNVEYEVYAPGEQILSTLPGDRYAKLSGTSMAAPIVAAQAAIIRSKYQDRDTYPTKFIYGQIVGTAENLVSCCSPAKHGKHNIPGVVNFHRSLTELPVPDLGMSDYTLFDTEGFAADTEGIADGASEVNNGDGIVDAGEIIALGMTLKNRWGMSENTVVHIDATSDSGVDNPYVTFLNNDINYGSVGTYSENDSGKIYSEDGEMWTGWEKPFYIKISKEIPNDYTITLNVTYTAENALDEDDPKIYSNEDKPYQILLKVRKGMILPNKITEDMTLTKDNYYIITNSTIIMEGVTVTVEEGTQIQFWSSDPGDAYAENGVAYLQVNGKLLCEGTEEEPIEIFPSNWMDKYVVEIEEIDNGYVGLEYTNVVNPMLSITNASYCEFTQNYERLAKRSVYSSGQVGSYYCEGYLWADKVEYSAFYKLGGSDSNNDYSFGLIYGGVYNHCAFIDCVIDYTDFYMGLAHRGADNINYCVFYGNNDTNRINGYGNSNLQLFGESRSGSIMSVVKNQETNRRYVCIKIDEGVYYAESATANYLPTIERFANFLGGHIVSIDSESEFEYLKNNFNNIDYLYLGITRNPKNGNYLNYIGSEIPEDLIKTTDDSYYGTLMMKNGEFVPVDGNNSGYTIIEILDPPYITDIQLKDYLVNLDLESSYQIAATLTPETASLSSLIYESQDETVVTVDDKGMVTPVGPGCTTVKVYSSDYAVYNYVTFNVGDEVMLEALEFPEADISVGVGAAKNLNIKFVPENTTKRALSYISSNEDVVHVDEAGRIYGISAGIAEITVTGDQGISICVNVRVLNMANSMYFADETYVTNIDAEDGTSFYPVIEPIDATNVGLTWESSNPEVCYVDENGTLVKLKTGTSKLKASLEDSSLTATVTVAVIDCDPSANIIKMQRDALFKYFFALKSDGTIWVWGDDYNTSTHVVPAQIEIPTTDIVDFAVNKYGVQVLDSEGTVKNYKWETKYKTLIEDSFDIELKNIASLSASYFSDNYTDVYVVGKDGSLWKYMCDSVSVLDIEANIVKAVAAKYGALFLSEDGDVYSIGGTIGGSNTVNIEPVKVCSYANDIYPATYTNEINIDTGSNVQRWSTSYQDKNEVIEKLYPTEKIVNHRSYIKDGCVYVMGLREAYFSYEEYTRIPGISNAAKVFDLQGTVFIQTEDNRFYAVGRGTNYALGNGSLNNSDVPIQMYFGLVNNPDSLELENWNPEYDVKGDLVLTENNIILDYNQALEPGTAYSSISLQDGEGNYLAFSKKLDLDKLIVTPRNGMKKGETYTITVSSRVLTERGGTYNEAFTGTFVYGEVIEAAPVIKMMEYNMQTVVGEPLSKMKLALLDDGSLWTWGGASDETIMLPFDGVKDFSVWSDYAGWQYTYHLYVLTEDGVLKRYAATDNHFLDGLTEDTSFTPLEGIAALASNQYSMGTWFAITEEGTVYGWGDNSWYQLGSGSNIDGTITEPLALEIAEPIQKVIATDCGTAYLAESGNVYLSGGAKYTTITQAYTGASDIYAQPGSYAYREVYIDLGDTINYWDFNTGNGGELLKIVSNETYGEHRIYIEYGTPYVKCNHTNAVWNEYTPLSEITDAVRVFEFNRAVYIQCENGDFYAVGQSYSENLGENFTSGSNGPFLIPFDRLPSETAGPVINSAVIDEEKIAERHYWTPNAIIAEWAEFSEKGYHGHYYGNVFLNRLNDDDVNKWLRFTASSGSGDTVAPLGGNYWGTTNKELINKQIVDFDDLSSLIDINEGEILTTPPSNTFPFVVDAYLEVERDTDLGTFTERVDTVGNELVTFCVEFNRDMDTGIPLTVRFGSSYPYGEYEIEGSYVTPRLWKGTMQLTTIIENGYQYWSVSNGKAAGTSLKLYTDWGRFPFKIDTTAAQALTMQAETTFEGIKLTWQQDDFDTLAGYNLYRSTEEDGLYTKINTTVIPADTKEWFDDTVEPGATYYYNFTVVQTDFNESEPSGKVVVTAMDTMAPNIYHSPVYHAFTGSNLVISATVTDNVGINAATLYYRTTGSEEWKSQTMTNYNDKYSAVISSSEVTVEGLEYYIDATDGISHTYKGSAEAPYLITVQLAVADSDKGDVDGNGAIELKDALMLLMALNDRLNLTEEQLARADLDGSGNLAAKEALRIIQYVNGSITSVLQ